MKRLLLPLLTALASVSLIGCSPKISCVRSVSFDTREEYDGQNFLVELDKSRPGRAWITNLLTGDKQYLLVNDVYRNRERTSEPFLKSIDDVKFTRLKSGAVLYFNEGCEED